jgi:hypothetical protein
VRPPGEVVASTLGPARRRQGHRLAAGRTSRRGFLLRAGLLGTALAVDPKGYVLRPGHGVRRRVRPGAGAQQRLDGLLRHHQRRRQRLPAGSIAAGWWKSDRASLCGGKARYIIDCNATCARARRRARAPASARRAAGPARARAGLPGSCDQRKVCCNAFRYGQCNQDVRRSAGVHCRVVSVHPAVALRGVLDAPATDNRHGRPQQRPPAAGVHADHAPVHRARRERLGARRVGLRRGRHGDGRAQRYQFGRISYASSTGARETVGPIADALRGHRAPRRAARLPGDVAAAGRAGQRAGLRDGRISYTPDTGAWETRGAIA